MANVTVTTSTSNVNVNSTTNEVNVSSTISNVVVGQTTTVSNAVIRSAITATDPILYNSTSGVISVNNTSLLSGQTTTNLTEGSNLYYTNARVQAYIGGNIVSLNSNTQSGLQSLSYTQTLGNSQVLFANSQVALGQTIFDGGNFAGNGAGNVFYDGINRGSLTGISSKTIPTSAPGSENVFFGTFQTPDFLNGVQTSKGYLIHEKTAFTFAKLTPFDGNNAQFSPYASFNSGTSTINAVTLNDGHVTAGRISINAQPGNINTVGNITGAYLYGDGSNITNVSQLTNSQVQAFIESNGLNGTAPITTTGTITAGYLAGDGSNITGVSTLTNAQVISHIATVPLAVGGNLSVTGNIDATGNINYQNVTDLFVRDQKITLNANATTDATVEVISNRPQAGANTVLRWNETDDKWQFTNDGSTYNDILTTSQVRGLISTSTASASGGGTLAYNNTTGVLTFAPADLTSKIGLSDLSVTQASASGTGTLAYNNGTGVFTYTPPSLTSFIDLTDLSVTTNSPSGDGALAYNSGTGVFTFTPADSNAAPVDSVNGQTGAVVLTTTNIAEGTNEYFTTARANTAISGYTGNILNSTHIGAHGIWTTTDSSSTSANAGIIVQDGLGASGVQGGGYILRVTDGDYSPGNQADANSTYTYELRGNTNNSTNGGIDHIASGGLIGKDYRLKNFDLSLDYPEFGSPPPIGGNIHSVNNVQAKSLNATDLVATGNVRTASLNINQPFLSNSNVEVLDVSSIGYAPYVHNITNRTQGGDGANYSGATSLNGFLANATVTAGNSQVVITGIGRHFEYSAAGQSPSALFNDAANITTILGEVTANSVVKTGQLIQMTQAPFAKGTYITGVDAANAKITVSKNPISSSNLTVATGRNADSQNALWIGHGARNDSLNYVEFYVSYADLVGSAANNPNFSFYTITSTLDQFGAPPSGFTTSELTYTDNLSSSDWTVAQYTSSGKTIFEVDNGFMNTPNGLTVGERTTMGFRSFADSSGSTFGLNVGWDGVSTALDYGAKAAPVPQIGLGSYLDNTTQASVLSVGPRILMQSRNGNVNVSELDQYPRATQELGRLSFYGTHGNNPNPPSLSSPGYISFAAADDWTDGSNTNAYLVATSNYTDSSSRDPFLSYEKGTLILASGQPSSSQANIQFAPAKKVSSNPQGAYNFATDALDQGSQGWATMNYSNVAATSGAKLSVNNGMSLGAGTVGDMQVSIHRRDNSYALANTDVLVDEFYTGALAASFGGPNNDLVGVVNGATIGSGDRYTFSGITNSNWSFLNGNTYQFTSSVFGPQFKQILQVGGANVTQGGGSVFTAQPAAQQYFSIGQAYRIVTAGTTDFTIIGAADNNVGTTFTASGTALVTAGSFVNGKSYTIRSTGSTDFTAIGASSNSPGTGFIATGVGSGTGTASQGNGAGSLLLTGQYTFANQASSGVTDREYNFSIAEQSESLVLKSTNSSTPTTSELLSIDTTVDGTNAEDYKFNFASPIFHKVVNTNITPSGGSTGLDDRNYRQFTITTSGSGTCTFNASGLADANTGNETFLSVINSSGASQTIATTNTTPTLSYTLADGAKSLIKLTHVGSTVYAQQEI